MHEEPTRGPGRPPKAELFPVMLLKNYRPVGDFKVEHVEENGRSTWQEPSEQQKAKTLAGTKIQLPKNEARAIISKGIAERGDEI